MCVCVCALQDDDEADLVSEADVSAWNERMSQPFVKGASQPQAHRICGDNSPPPCPPGVIAAAEKMCATHSRSWGGAHHAGRVLLFYSHEQYAARGVGAEGGLECAADEAAGNDCRGDDESTWRLTARAMHAGCSVTKGFKVVLGKFVRSGPKPFSDEEAFRAAMQDQ